MAPRQSPEDDEYAPGRNLFWVRPVDDDENDESIQPLPLPSHSAPGEANAREYVKELFPPPRFGAPDSGAGVRTLREAASEKLASAGLSGNGLAPMPGASESESPVSGGDVDSSGTPAPRRPLAIATILGNDTAQGSTPPPVLNDAIEAAGPVATAAPPESLDTPAAASPLDHPDARTGLALAAADALLRRGAAALAQVAGGDRALIQQAVEGAVAWLGNLLPPEYRASAAKSGALALADVDRQILEHARAARTQAAIRTLAIRRGEAEHAFAQALIVGDPDKLAEARRDAVNAWAAERRARGDGEAEINARARALDAQYRKTALQHRLAQLDESGIERALEEDPDAKADPATARAVADAILRTRRDDPARAGEATIERAIETRQRDGRIDSAEDETAIRYRLRLQAQAARGIPEGQRRLLTNDERTQIAADYLRFESQSGKDAADAWLEVELQKAGTNTDRLRKEITNAPKQGRGSTSLGSASRGDESADEVDLRAEPAQQKNDSAPPLSDSEIVRRPPQDEADRSERDEAARKEGWERTKAFPDDWKKKHEVILEIAKREGFVPALVRTHLWGQFRSTNPKVSIEEKLDAARAIAELARLFPDEIERHINKGELALISEVVRLDDEGQVAPEQILTQAERNVGYPNLRWFIGAIAGARAGRAAREREVRPRTPEELAKKQREMAESKTVGGRTETQGTEIIGRDIERFNLSIGPKKLVLVPGDGGTIPDLPLRTKSDQIPVFVEIKKFGARHRDPQRRRLRALGAHYVEIDPDKGQMRALVPPYDKWITYDEWLQYLETMLEPGSR